MSKPLIDYTTKELRDAAIKLPAWGVAMATNGYNAATVSKGQLIEFLTANGITEVAESPVPAPRAVAPVSAIEGLDEEEAALIQKLRESRRAAPVDEAKIIELIKLHGGKPATVTLNIVKGEVVKREEGALVHYAFPLLLAGVNAGVNIMLVGPAGSGKTTAAEQVAHTLGLTFGFTGAIDSPYKLSGFIDAQGRIVHTEFRRCYENGGVFLFDEIDASSPGAVLAFNAALANGHADFPDGMIGRHKDFRAIAAANTFGTGASRVYVGRNQQDAAALDRYATLVWDYDAALEAAMVCLPRPEGAPLPRDIKTPSAEKLGGLVRDWTEEVTKARKAVDALAVRHVVSPRATLNGAKLIAAGWTWSEVAEACLWKGMDKDTKAKVTAAMKG